MLNQLKRDLKKFADPKKAEVLQRFFKTGKGEYGEGDIFLGLKLPETRSVLKNYRDMPLAQIKELIKSPIHDFRIAAVLLLVWQFEHGAENQQKKIYNFYLKNTQHINNWDLVDLSAPNIVGGWLLDKKDRSILNKLAASNNLWKQRIAILATYQFIKQEDFRDTLRIGKTLLHHDHDLIHKAVGWMLREVGNRDLVTEEKFLIKHYKTMPRTALRYAIEKFPDKKRQKYLKGTI